MFLIWIFRRLYAAIVIAVNYVLMMTWLPSMVIIVEKMNMKLCKCWQSYVDSINVVIERIGNSMENAIIRSVDRLKYVFLILFCKRHAKSNQNISEAVAIARQ